MKRLLIFLAMLAVTAGIIAQETAPALADDVGRNYRLEAANVLERGNKAFKGENAEVLKDIVFHLSLDEKLSLYDSFKKKSAGAAFLNWFPGFGFGSYSQGDKVGGTLILVSDICTTGAAVVCVGSFCAGLIATIFEAPFAALSEDDDDDMAATKKLFTAAGVSFLIGGGLWVCARLYGTFRPIAYKNSYNKKLRSSLELPKKVQVAPVVLLQSKEYGFVASVKL